MFKKLSLTNFIVNIEATIRRFPLVVLMAASATTIALLLLHEQEYEYVWLKILMFLALAFLLFISSTLLYESNSWQKKYKYLADVVVILFVTLYYLWFPSLEDDMGAKLGIIFALMVLISLLSITFTGFIVRKKELINAFWQYNKNFVFSAILTVIYTGVIGAGLSIALMSVDYLFDLNIIDDRYAEIWITLWTLFAPLFFLSRVPKDLLALEEDKNYPKELRLFTQFVLLPLVSLYFIILYSYTFKVVISWEWPKGTLAYMISGFSLLGVIIYLISYPLRDSYKWAKKFSSIFFIVLIPQAGMLFWALWFRVSSYGITENRSLVFIFGCWLILMAIYFLFGKKKDIRLIPISLAVIIFLSMIGPWSIFNVSRHSQTSRLFSTLEKYNAIEQGKIIKIAADVVVEDDDKKEISSMINYLYDMHGPEYVQKLFSKEYNINEYNNSRDIVKNLIGVDYMTTNGFVDHNYRDFLLLTREPYTYELKSFDYLSIINDQSGYLISEDSGLKYNIVTSTAKFEITKNDEVLIDYNLDEFISSSTDNNVWSNYRMDRDDMIINTENDKFIFKFYLNYIEARILQNSQEDSKYNYIDIDGLLLYSEK